VFEIAMLTLYHTPLSINSRRVWVALIEKGLDFELQEVNLAGDQFTPEFLAMNPFHHIPVLVDGDRTVIESFAILDYLEAQYPTPPLMPTAPADVARVRMVQMATLNELMPAVTPLTRKMMGFGDPDADALQKALKQGTLCLSFFAQQLGDRPFYGGETVSLADVVLGTVAPWFEQLGLPLDNHAPLKAWCDRLVTRPAWQTTAPTPEMIEAFRERMRQLMDQRP
jgi:glutathione S-transferase